MLPVCASTLRVACDGLQRIACAAATLHRRARLISGPSPPRCTRSPLRGVYSASGGAYDVFAGCVRDVFRIHRCGRIHPFTSRIHGRRESAYRLPPGEPLDHPRRRDARSPHASGSPSMFARRPPPGQSPGPSTRLRRPVHLTPPVAYSTCSLGCLRDVFRSIDAAATAHSRRASAAVTNCSPGASERALGTSTPTRRPVHARASASRRGSARRPPPGPISGP